MPMVSQRLLARLGDVLLFRLKVALKVIQLLGEIEDFPTVDVGHSEVFGERITVATFNWVSDTFEVSTSGIVNRNGISQPRTPLVPVELEGDVGAGRRL